MSSKSSIRHGRVLSSHQVKTYSDDGTLNVVETSSVKRAKFSTPAYGLLFPSSCSWAGSLSSPIPFKLFFHFISSLSIGDIVVRFSSDSRKRLMSDYGISRVSLWSGIQDLVRHRVICPVCNVDSSTGEVRISRSEYAVNPSIFWRGDLYLLDGAMSEYDSYLDLYHSNFSDDGQK